MSLLPLRENPYRRRAWRGAGTQPAPLWVSYVPRLCPLPSEGDDEHRDKCEDASGEEYVQEVNVAAHDPLPAWL